MKNNETKEKGDIGLSAVIFDLSKKGYSVFHSISEHLPFDLIAYKEKRFIRIQVKYREEKEGIVEVSFRSCYSNSKGTHISFYDKDDIDLFAVFCPQTDKVYYIDHKKFNKCISLRTQDTKSGQDAKINKANDFLEINFG